MHSSDHLLGLLRGLHEYPRVHLQYCGHRGNNLLNLLLLAGLQHSVDVFLGSDVVLHIGSVIGQQVITGELPHTLYVLNHQRVLRQRVVK